MKSFWSDKRVTVTGGAGFLGQHLVRRLESYGARVFVPRKRDYDLTALDGSLRCLLEHPCDVLFHAAAYYGGIGINVAPVARPDSITHTATSLTEALGRPIGRTAVAARLLREIAALVRERSLG